MRSHKATREGRQKFTGIGAHGRYRVQMEHSTFDVFVRNGVIVDTDIARFWWRAKFFASLFQWVRRKGGMAWKVGEV